jgi:hypothetical protein
MAHTKKKMTIARGKSSKVGGSKGMVSKKATVTKKKGMKKGGY